MDGMTPERRSPGFRPGDIIVTPVSHYYAIGRIEADGRTQVSLGSEGDRATALTIACEFAGSVGRVFVWTTNSEQGLVRVVCGDQT